MQHTPGQNLTILFIEDSLDDFHLIGNILRREFENVTVVLVDTKSGFLEALEKNDFSLIICDHNLPQFSSKEVLSHLRETHINIPVVIVTGAMTDEIAVKSLGEGATDYVLKSNLSKLPWVIKNLLKHRESERLKKHATNELARRNEELSKINKELDSFVYSVSHNLRSPLRSLMGLLDLAMKETDLTSMQKYHGLMQGSIQKLDGTLQDILDYSRNARQDLQVQEVDLRKLIEENFEKMSYMPGFKTFTTNVVVDQSAKLFTDQYRLSVIFNNLISNSIKYADPLKVNSFIHINAKISRHEAVVEFSDNGIGIERSALPDVFKMFYRATEKADGSGLGLYILKEAIEMLKGKVMVKSIVNEGTTFTLTIPNQAEPSKRKAPSSIFIDMM